MANSVQRRWQNRVGRPLVAMLLAAALLPALSQAAEAAAGDDNQTPTYTTTSIRGRVVWLGDVLSRRFQIKSVPEASQRVLVLETPQGEIVPLVEDLRGRSFRLDERLRGIDLELLVRRYEGSPMVQVIRVFALRDDGKYELDYWCEICAIAMFELKACDCCQGEIELRFRRAQDQAETK